MKRTHRIRVGLGGLKFNRSFAGLDGGEIKADQSSKLGAAARRLVPPAQSDQASLSWIPLSLIRFTDSALR